MIDIDYIQEIWDTLHKRRARTFFTTFGVAWGMTILVVLLGCGLGVERAMRSTWGETSTNAAYFYGRNASLPYKGLKKGRSVHLKTNDMTAIKSRFKDIEYISPSFWNNANIVIRGDKSKENVPINGLSADFYQISPCLLSEGRIINEIDVVQNRKVCMIGSQIKNGLFGAEKAEGTLIWIDGVAYTVIAVMEKSTDVNIFGDPEQMIFIPYTTFADIYNKGDIVDCIALSANKNANILDLETDIKNFLKERAIVSPDDKQGIISDTTKEYFDTVNNLFKGTRILIWVIGLGTLLAGMVCITNIMLISVRERTQEIGIRRALGATPFSVVRQILWESILMSLLAGVGGIVVGLGVSAVLEDIFTSIEGSDTVQLKGIYIPFKLAVIIFIILETGGLIAGLMPAYRAAQIKTIDALRDE